MRDGTGRSFVAVRYRLGRVVVSVRECGCAMGNTVGRIWSGFVRREIRLFAIVATVVMSAQFEFCICRIFVL